jgi:hypothetical protein
MNIGVFARFLLLLLTVATSACGALSDAEDKVFSSGWRQPEPVETLFLNLASDLWSEKPCYLIHPKSMRVAGFNSVGTQVSYVRSTCFRDVAEATNNPRLCDQVRSVSTLMLSGADLNREACVRATAGHSAVARGLDMPAILELAGYDAAAVDEFLASAGRFSSPAVARHFRDNEPGIFWNEVRQYVIASPRFFEQIDHLPGFATAEDLEAMKRIEWRPRFKRDLPLPEQRVSAPAVPEMRIELEADDHER